MKLNKILVALLIAGMLACSFSAVFAEDGTLEDGTAYTIPDTYSVLKSEKGIVTLATEDQSKVVTVTDVNVVSAEEGKQAQIDTGAEFVSEDKVTINGVEVTEQKFTKDGLNLYGYLFNVNDVAFSITAVNNDADWNVEDAANPVNVVITSLTGTGDAADAESE